MAREAKAAMKKEQQESLESEQIEVAPAMVSDMGGIAVETEEPSEDEDQPEEAEEDEPESTELAEIIPTVPGKIEGKKTAERTDDPVLMYLREMALVELLSRAGEIAIAKRIEAGREAMIAGMCESPLTFGAITIWRDELNEGRVFLREIIDLEATYAGPDCKLMSAAVMHPEGHAIAHPAPVSATLGEPSVVPTAAAPAAPCAPTPPDRRGPKANRTTPAPPRPANANSTTKIWRTRSPLQRLRPSSSRRSSQASIISPTPTSGFAACRTRISSSSSRTPPSLPLRSVATRSSRTQSSPR